MRAHAILLSNQGYPINEIAMILSVERDSVFSWIDSWQEREWEQKGPLPLQTFQSTGLLSLRHSDDEGSEDCR